MAEGEGEGAPEGDEKKKGGAKKLIIKIIPLVLIALVVAKMTVLKPAPPTPAQAAAKAAADKYELDVTCSLANDMKAPKAPAGFAGAAVPGTTPTTEKPAEAIGPTLDRDSKTINLDGNHFLKIGVSLQLPSKSVPDDVKITENWGSLVAQLAIDTFSGRSFAELSQDGV